MLAVLAVLGVPGVLGMLGMLGVLGVYWVCGLLDQTGRQTTLRRNKHVQPLQHDQTIKHSGWLTGWLFGLVLYKLFTDSTATIPFGLIIQSG